MDSNTRAMVAVIGAGPFGVSIAAHLQSAGVNFRIFGKPMHRWQSLMPKGMFLKSEGRASNLSDPTRSHTLARYCSENALPYEEGGGPIPLEIFTRYALSFQRNLAPNVEEVMVTDDEPVVKRWLTTWSRVPVSDTSKLDPTRDYYVRVTTRARPVGGSIVGVPKIITGQAKFTFLP